MSGKVLLLHGAARAPEPSHGECVQALELALAERGLSRKGAAKRLGVSRRTLQRWLSGRQRIDVESLCQDPTLGCAFARHLSVLLADLIVDLAA